MLRNRTIELKGQVVRLRKYRLEDATVLYEKLGCDPEMMRYTGWNPYASCEAAQSFVEKVLQNYEQEKKEYSWIIEANGVPVGIIGAYDENQEEKSIEIGYSIFREFWGRGYASEAVALVCEYLLSDKEICRIRAWSASENGASRRILEKTGFVQTNIYEAMINVRGNVYHQVCFEKVR